MLYQLVSRFSFITRYIIPITINDEKVIIGAIPFIRDKDVRKGGDFEIEMDRIQLVKEGIEDVYINLKKEMERVDGFESAATIAMGHLFLQNSSTSDSERDIQVGNLAGLNSGVLSNMFDYVALGHIHRPQSFDDGKVRYSGSPIPLSFSERKDQKQIVIAEVADGKVRTFTIECPIYRNLLKVEGTFEEVRDRIINYTSNNPLPTFIEVIVKEKVYSYTLLSAVRNFIQSLERNDLIILKEKVVFESKAVNLKTTMPKREIQDVKPKEVFRKRLDAEKMSDVDKKAAEQGFDQLLQEVSDGIV